MLIKIYADQRYAESLLDQGQVHLKTVRFFQEMEDDGSGRADPYDSVKLFAQPNNFRLGFRMEGGNGEVFDLTPNLVPKPLAIYSNLSRARHVFCTYALKTSLHLNRFQQGLPLIDGELLALGGFAVVFPLSEFLDRCRKAAFEQGLTFIQGDLVRYVDFSKYGGMVGPYIKSDKFSWQSEYRFLFEETGKEYVNLTVGSLRDIAFSCPVEKLNQELGRVLRTYSGFGTIA